MGLIRAYGIRRYMASNDEPKNVTRRDVLGVAVGGSATAFALAVAYPVAKYVEPPRRPAGGPATVGKVEEFPVDGAKMVMADERPVLVFRSSDGQFRAFSALCTHLQCVVAYSPERRQIECPCHRGVYSLEGINIEGPPPRPLDELLVSVNEGLVIVSSTR